MSTTFEEQVEKERGLRVAIRSGESRWARICTTLGAAVWAGIAVAAHFRVARIGGIELLFLFAPLVIVPLGMELGRAITSSLRAQNPLEKWSSRFDLIARRVQPVAAVCAVIAMLMAPGRRAAVFASGWMVVCLFIALEGVIHFFSVAAPDEAGQHESLTLFRLTILMARLDLVVGGSWLVASRLGMHPLGIQEPIGLLTAVHFHFAGFATAMIAAAMLRFSRGHVHEAWLKWIVPVVIGIPYVVAIGFVVSPVLKVVAATVFSASVATLAVFLRACGTRAEESAARVLLQVAAAAVFAGMVFSITYAIADFLGSDVLTIPQMARTHGILNAVGFCMTGMLGWLVEFGARSPAKD